MLIQFHLKLALRSLLAQKKFSLISILSLSLAFVSVVIIALWIINELSYDRHFSKHERIYRLTLQVKTPEGYESHFARVAQDWVQQVGDFIPEIENTVRFAPKRTILVTSENNKFSSDRTFITDTTVFQVFDLRLIEGDKSSALSNPKCAIISASISEKYFNNSSPIGKYISLIGQNEYEQSKYLITGVFQDFPMASHIHPEILLSFDDPGQYGWAFFYLLANKNTRPELLSAKLDEYLEKNVEPEEIQNLSLHLQPLADIHLYSHKDREAEINGNIQSVYIMAAIALMILLLAIFNYINLNIAQLFREIRFLTINKMYGASTGSIFQFQLIKSSLIAALATILSILFFVLLRSTLSSWFNIDLSYQMNMVYITLFILLFLFITAIMAGSVPAFQFIVSRFNQKLVLRNTNLVKLFRPHKRFLFRKILIGVQFIISLVLIISTLFAAKQMQYMGSTQLGAAQGERIIVIKNLSPSVRPMYFGFRNELLQSPYILDVTATMELPSSPIKDAFGFEADCPLETTDQRIYVGPVADNFFRFYDQTIVAGSDFPEYIQGQEFESYLLNESAVRFLGWTDPTEAIGKSFMINFMAEGFFFGGKIHGVVQDFHQASVHHSITPTVYFQQPAFYLSFMIKVSDGNFLMALSTIEEQWLELFPDYPFTFVDQDLLYETVYAKELAQTRLAFIFSILAIIITLIGLTGLTSILAVQRTRETGIRRVLGASFTDILFNLSREILIIMVISIAVAIPLSIILTGHWLQNFAYAIIPGNFWWIPAVVSLAAFVLISLIVIITVFQTARRNPVESLRME